MTDVTVSDLLAPPAPAPVPNLHTEPSTAWGPPKSVHEQAATLRDQLISNPEFRQKYFNGDPASRQQMAALDSIKISDPNADPAALRALADQAGIVETPRPAMAAPISPLSAQAPTPASYDLPRWGNLRNELPPDRYNNTVTEWTGWASAMKFSPVFGQAILSHLVDLGSRVSSMSTEAREAFVMEEESRGMLAAGPDAYKAIKSDAMKALDMAGNNPVAKFLKNNAVLDGWTLNTLARYYRSQRRG
jgi:hypothetical protein